MADLDVSLCSPFSDCGRADADTDLALHIFENPTYQEFAALGLGDVETVLDAEDFSNTVRVAGNVPQKVVSAWQIANGRLQAMMAAHSPVALEAAAATEGMEGQHFECILLCVV